jgi:hypothetical protein
VAEREADADGVEIEFIRQFIVLHAAPAAVGLLAKDFHLGSVLPDEHVFTEGIQKPVKVELGLRGATGNR